MLLLVLATVQPRNLPLPVQMQMLRFVRLFSAANSGLSSARVEAVEPEHGTDTHCMLSQLLLAY